jgi:hypothetical protein
MYQCSYCPGDATFVCVTGHGILKFLRIDPQSGEFKTIPSNLGKREPQNYLSHAWMEDKLLIGTDAGDILLFGDGGDFRGVVAAPCDGPVETILGHAKFFVCGSTEGTMQLYEKDEKDGFKKKPPFTLKNNPGKVTSLALAPSEDVLLCTTDNNQAYMYVVVVGGGGGGGGHGWRV